MKIPTFLIKIDESDEGVQFVSLVESPAIEQNFLAFSKAESIKFSENPQKRILTGALMLANTPIKRKDKDRGLYYVIFTPETIEKMVMRFFKQNNIRNVNIEHSADVEGVYMFESYIINKSRGINAPNEFKDIPDGSWFGSYKIENESVWQNRNEFKGFSIEGYFGLEPMVDESQDEDIDEPALEDFMKSLNDFLQTIQ